MRSTSCARDQGFGRRSPVLLIAITLVAVTFLGTTVYSFLHLQRDPKLCRMSYMYPSYVRQDGFDLEHTRLAQKYSLYLYREQGTDSIDGLTGVPALFVPGNAGSYKQIRPIGSETATQFAEIGRVAEETDKDLTGRKGIDFFTVDFNEDFSAFHGQTLLDQAEYLNAAIAYILSLYTAGKLDQAEPDPSSVIMIGHSMGGISARSMLTMPNYLEKSVNTIITMSTPHALPPAPFDSRMQQIYGDLNAHWARTYANSSVHSPLHDVSIVSIAGGGLDTIVSSDYTSIEGIVPPTHGLTVFTSAIPGVWTCADHQAILWCDQFRKIIARTLLDIIDARHSTKTKSIEDRMQVFRKHLVAPIDRPGQSTQVAGSASSMVVAASGPHTRTMFSDEPLYLIADADAHDAHDRIFLMPVPHRVDSFQLMTNVLAGQQFSASAIEVRLCRLATPHLLGSRDSDCVAIGDIVTTLPSQDDLRGAGSAVRHAYFHVAAAQLAKYDHVMVRATLADNGAWLRAVFVATREELVVGQSLLGPMGLSLRPTTFAILQTQAFVSTVKLLELTNSLIAYKLSIKSPACSHEHFSPLLRQAVLAIGEAKYHALPGDDHHADQVNINFHGYAPFFPLTPSANKGLQLLLWRDPTCAGTINFTLRVDPIGSAGMLVMRYRVAFVTFAFMVALLVFETQFRASYRTGAVPSFQQALRHVSKSYLPTILVSISLGSLLASWLVQRSQTSAVNTHVSGLPTRLHAVQVLLGLPSAQLWWLAPTFVIVAAGSLNIMSTALELIIWTFGHGVNAVRRYYMPDQPTVLASTNSAHDLQRRIVVTGILLLIVATFVPYQFAYFVACLAQLMTCVRLQAQVAHHNTRKWHRAQRSNVPTITKIDLKADDHAAARRREVPEALVNACRHNFAILVLMMLVLPIDAPVLIVWLRNMASNFWSPFSSHHNVLSVAPTILLVEQLAAGRLPGPRRRRLRSGSDAVDPARPAEAPAAEKLVADGWSRSSTPTSPDSPWRIFSSEPTPIAVTLTALSAAVVAALYGIMRAFLLHQLFNLLAAVVFVQQLLCGSNY